MQKETKAKIPTSRQTISKNANSRHQTLEQEPLHPLLQLQQTIGNRALQNLLQAQSATAPSEKQKRPPARSQTDEKIETILTSYYPHLDKILTKEQKNKIKAVARYRKQLSIITKRLACIEHVSAQGTWSLSENGAEINRLHNQRDTLLDKVWNDSHLSIDTSLLLDQKSLAMENSGKPSKAATDSETVVNGYKQLLHRTLASQPSVLLIENCDLDKNPAHLIKIIWGKHQWELSHTGGLVNFSNLMQIQVFNVEYQEVLIKGQLDLLNKMLEIAKSVSPGEKREPDDPIVLAMSRKEKMMKALEYSVDHFSAVDAAKRVFGATPQQLAINIGIMIGVIVTLAIIGSLGPVGAAIAGGISAALLVLFGIDTLVTTIKALKHLYDDAGGARNQKDLADTGKQFAQEGGEAALKILLFIISGKVVKRFAKGGKGSGPKTEPNRVFDLGEQPPIKKTEPITVPIEPETPQKLLGPGQTKNPPLLTAGKTGNFVDVRNLHDFLSRIPPNATRLPWKEIPNGAKQGIKFKWTDSKGDVYQVRAHEMDPSAPSNSNASRGWIYRVEVRYGGKGKTYYMDSSGKFHPENVLNESSPMYDPGIANDTHIPFSR